MGLNKIALVAGALMLTGCGYKSHMTRLDPPNPEQTKAEQKAAREAERKVVREGLEIPAEARPIRVDDLMISLGERTDDPFNLPPEGSKDVATVPFPTDPEPEPAIKGIMPDNNLANPGA